MKLEVESILPIFLIMILYVDDGKVHESLQTTLNFTFLSFEHRVFQVRVSGRRQPQLRGSIPQQHDPWPSGPGAALHGRKERQRWSLSGIRLYQSDRILR